MGQGADGRRRDHDHQDRLQDLLAAVRMNGHLAEFAAAIQNVGRETDGQRAEREARQRIGAAMARAIADAEVATQARSEADLAQEAYQSLGFDFPMVSTAALAALASTSSKALAKGALLPLPVTAPFITGMCYLAHSAAASNAPRSPLTSEEAAETAPEEGRVRLKHIHTIVGCTLVKLPAVCLAACRQDSGVALRSALAAYSPLWIHAERPAVPAVVSDPDAESAAAAASEQEDAAAREMPAVEESEGRGEEGDGYAMAAELDDDEAEWEPLEASPSAAPLAIPNGHLRPPHGSHQPQAPHAQHGEEAHGVTDLDPPQLASWQELLAKLAELAGYLQYARVCSPGVWEELRLVDAILEVLGQTLRVAHQQPLGEEAHGHVGLVVRAYVELLCERLLRCPGGGEAGPRDGVGKVLSRVLQTVGVAGSSGAGGPAVGGGQAAALPPAVQADGQRLALLLLATLCSRLPAGGGSQARGPAGASGDLAKRLLWPELGAALPWLGLRLAVLTQERRTDHEWAAELGRILAVLLAYVQTAPGNADLGQPLLESGVCRAAVALFVRAGDAPAMEDLRGFMLLASAAAPSVARYAAAVPGFRSQLAAAPFRAPPGPAGAHGLLWPLVFGRHLATPPQQLPAGKAGTGEAGAEEPLAGLLDRVAQLAGSEPISFVELAVEASYLQRTLTLLQTAAAAARGPLPRLWTKSGCLSTALSACQLAVRDAATRQVATLAASASSETDPEAEGRSSTAEAGGEGSSRSFEVSGGQVAGSDRPEAREPAGTPEPGSQSRAKVEGELVCSADEEKAKVDGEDSQSVLSEDDGKEKAPKKGFIMEKNVGGEAEVARQKVRELLPRLAQQLKILGGHSRGSHASVKDD